MPTEPASPAERRLQAQLAAHSSWAATTDRAGRTAAARQAAADRFERQVDPDGVLPAEERFLRAEHARRAYFLGLALKSAQARRRTRNREHDSAVAAELRAALAAIDPGQGS